MSISLQKIFKENGLGVIIVILLVAYGVYYFSNYLTGKGSYGTDSFDDEPNQAYKNYPNSQSVNGNGVVQPAEALGQNEKFASVNGVQTSMPGVPNTCSTVSIQNPAELLPRDDNSAWSQMNPVGMGDLSNQQGLISAQALIGIDTIGQSLRNANLQIRSEPPNPQVYVGPWNMSTITPDLMRPPLEISTGAQ